MSFQAFIHVIAQCSRDCLYLTVCRIRKAQHSAVQRMDFQHRAVSAVEIIAEQRIADMREMNADLMRPSGFEHQLQQGAPDSA